jgi:hypothetical protein
MLASYHDIQFDHKGNGVGKSERPAGLRLGQDSTSWPFLFIRVHATKGAQEETGRSAWVQLPERVGGAPDMLAGQLPGSKLKAASGS